MAGGRIGHTHGGLVDDRSDSADGHGLAAVPDSAFHRDHAGRRCRERILFLDPVPDSRRRLCRTRDRANRAASPPGARHSQQYGQQRRKHAPAARIHDLLRNPVDGDFKHLDGPDHDADGPGRAGRRRHRRRRARRAGRCTAYGHRLCRIDRRARHDRRLPDQRHCGRPAARNDRGADQLCPVERCLACRS